MVSALRGALTLAMTGHGREVPILIRLALEALITLLFIAKEDSALRARRWVQFAHVAKRKLMKKHPHLFRGPKHRNARRRITSRARRVEKYFPNDNFWASGLHCGSLRDIAKKVGMLWHYDSVYWAGSQPTHASAIAVEEHIGVGSDGTPVFKIGLSGVGVRREIAVYCDLLIRRRPTCARATPSPCGHIPGGGDNFGYARRRTSGAPDPRLRVGGGLRPLLALLGVPHHGCPSGVGPASATQPDCNPSRHELDLSHRPRARAVSPAADLLDLGLMAVAGLLSDLLGIGSGGLAGMVRNRFCGCRRCSRGMAPWRSLHYVGEGQVRKSPQSPSPRGFFESSATHGYRSASARV